MSQTKAQLVSGSAAQDLTVDNINTTSINSAQPSGRRNLIINGAMQVAQRGTSSTDNGYQTVDRFSKNDNGTDEQATQSQVDVSSGTTPYTSGFRKAYRLTNGNQTSGAGSSDRVVIIYAVEAQDVVNSGWNYLSSSSFITFSFWVKSSVAQNFYGRVQTQDGTKYNYPFETGSLTADTWTKITKTIPGNSNLQIDNDNGSGLHIEIIPFRGTATTGSVSLNAWGVYDSSVRVPDMTSTWYTTNDATFEVTGVQLEAGTTATDFEHRSFAEELALCQRYFQSISRSSSTNSVDGTFAAGTCNDNASSGGILQVMVRFQTTMRAVPTMTQSGTFSHHVSGVNVADTTLSFNQAYIDGIKCTGTQTTFVSPDGSCGELISKYSDSSTAIIKASAEL